MRDSITGPVSVEQCLAGRDKYKLCSKTECVPVSEKCPCEAGKFECSDGYCIPRSLVCDGVNNCKSGEDELCSDAATMEEGLSVSAVAAVVSVSVFLCVLLTVLLCMFFLRRQRTNISQESQAALNPLQEEKLSDEITYLDKSDRNYKTRHKYTTKTDVKEYTQSVDKLRCGENENLNPECEDNLDRYKTLSSEHESCSKAVQVNNRTNSQSHNINPSCQEPSLDTDRNTGDECDTFSTNPGMKVGAGQESQTKMGKYIFKPRTRKPPIIYHSYLPSHTEPSTPESIDFDRDKISFLFAQEFLCASTPKQTPKQLVIHEGTEIAFIDE